MVKKQIIFVLFILCKTYLGFSQEYKKDSLFYKEINEEIEKIHSSEFLKKASYFFVMKEWDSVLVYCDKELSEKTI